MTDKINTYEKLGRFMMNEVYNILLDTCSHTILYNNDLKDIIERRIDRAPHTDKKYAMHPYNHGNSRSFQHMFRWQNILYYYLAQHQNAGFLKIEDILPNGNFHHYYVMLNDGLLTKLPEFHPSTDMSYMFDLAQKRNKEIEKNLLEQNNATELTKLNILYIRQQGIANVTKQTK
ncbi:MAG: hypothetical protein J5714_04520 [Alphaproteobacteria bacterium]|nr:hypothetical protein [Alphaproteobacteria bacterium]